MEDIIAIEGFWRIGKTTLCKALSRKMKRVKYIREPDHLRIKVRPKNVEYWYLKKWKEKMELAKKYKKNGYTVIIERSFISTVAFHNALGKKTTVPMKELIRYHEQNIPDIVIILEAPLSFLKKIVFSKTDKKILKTRALHVQKSFFHRYIAYFYQSIADFKIVYFSIQVADNSQFYPLPNIVEKVLGRIK